MKSQTQKDELLGISSAIQNKVERDMEISLNARKAARGGRQWLNVAMVKLIKNKYYWVRRTFKDLPPFSPVMCQWTERGWDNIYGHLSSTTVSGASLDIWVK